MPSDGNSSPGPLVGPGELKTQTVQKTITEWKLYKISESVIVV